MNEKKREDDAATRQTRASLTFASITFSDGTVIEAGPRDIFVLVGPNNAGKSAALREMEKMLGKPTKMQVLHAATVASTGSVEDFTRAVKENSIASGQPGSIHYTGYGYNLSAQYMSMFWQSSREQIVPFFCRRIPTETRILSSNPPKSIALLERPPEHPNHILQANDLVEHRMSGYFHRAFGKDLMVYHGGGAQVPLFVGSRPAVGDGEDRISWTYLSRARDSMVPLHEQGDGMRSFATVLLNMLSLDTPSVLLLDEPEAFLHPPQARLLGEFIARERHADSQVFIATHSADVLQGLLLGSAGSLRIIRLQRQGEVNRARELQQAIIKDIAADPLLKSSSVLSGIFHQHVFICESDADALFYNSILDVPEVRGAQQPDALFVHGGGKHRMAKLATALRALDVPVSVIADIDVLNDESTFKGIIVALGGDWNNLKGLWRSIKMAIEEHKPWLTSQEIANAIKKELEKVPSEGEFPNASRKKIESLFRKASPWDVIKQGGKINIPGGQATKQFEQLDKVCQELGLWIVPVGELEGFAKSVEASHGPAWVQRVLEEKDLAKDAELAAARAFVKSIWSARPS